MGKGALEPAVFSWESAEPPFPLPGLASQVPRSRRGLGTVPPGLHLPVCTTGGLDSLLSRRPSNCEVGWGGLARGSRKEASSAQI